MAGNNPRMAERRSAALYLPERRDLPSLCAAVQGCRGCDLYKRATQAVLGEGPQDARVMFVGEQPGDEEDIAGHPFVGPAGRLLDEVLDEAGIGRDRVWLTNAVKHFKFSEVRRGKRIHEKPTMAEVGACRPWLDVEFELVQPEVVVLLGATAAQALFGSGFRFTKVRGQWQQLPDGRRALATWHPAAVLRGPEREDRHRKRAELLDDLRQVSMVLFGANAT